MIENYPILTLVPPLLAIILAIVTRKVIISLALGVVAAAVLIAGGNPLESLQGIWHSFALIFWEDGAINTYYVFILLFLVLLGIITAFVFMAGGTSAFSEWAVTRIRSRRGSQVFPWLLGLALFIDDYFNALAVGQISRPVTDRHRVSRAKLAYVVDSTSAPVSVLVPFSSWGASIIGLIAPVVAASALTVADAEAFIIAALYNYYAWAALLLVVAALIFKIDAGPMRREERRAIEEGKPHADNATVPGALGKDLPVHYPGAKRSLLIPFIALVVGILAGIAYTGWRSAGSWAPMDVLAETDVTTALLIGGVAGTVCALYYYVRYTRRNEIFGWGSFGAGLRSGTASMLPAIQILILAWMLGDLTAQLGTGDFLGDVVETAGLTSGWLIPIMFVVAGVMAFSTGTSWGSFGILIPIAGDIINSIGADDLLLPALGAVLAGAVWGDHCSPISDTTILSSTGASADVITHVITQLPYAVTGALAALAGYALYAATGSGVVGAIGVVIVVAGFTAAARHFFPPLDENARVEQQTATAGGHTDSQ